VVLVDRRTGGTVDPILADPATGQPVDEPDYGLAPGPAANDRVLQKYQAVAEARPAKSRRARRLSGTGRLP
jgi:hypothetical protein